ncbi:DNA-3-methyladenine glycosylase [Pseudomonas syringae]|uniref:DNA-3-methyladenine glycosylase II n=1 Tax=Pseudomonas syringae CC1417 TaxID=1357272 RepID=A0AAU8LHD9_PSESX
MSAEPLTSSRTAHGQAVDALKRIDARWQSLIEQVGPCLHPVTAAQDPFQALVKAVAYQQLHAKAGDAMVMRLRALFAGSGFPEPQQLAELDDQRLRGCGFSASKCRAIKAIAAARVSGTVPDVAEAMLMGDEELIARLVQLPGVGRWTVEMMLIYGLGRLDVMPASDFGVSEGYRRLYGLDLKPTPKAMTTLAERFAPFRTVAAWYLWRVPANFAAGDRDPGV